MPLKSIIFLTLIWVFFPLQVHAADNEKALAKAVVKVKPLKSVDDGYWAWFENYLDKRQAQRYLVNESRVKLSLLAKQKKKKRSRWFKLLVEELHYTETDLDESRGSSGSMFESPAAIDFFDQLISGKSAARIAAIRQDLKAERDSLRAEIRSLHQDQRKLIDEVLDETKMLHESVISQFKISEENHPELKDEVELLEEQRKLLKLELYDSAEWYAPHELTKLINQYEESEGTLPEYMDWLRVRAFIGEAEWLEIKVFMQLNAPTYQDPKQSHKEAQDRITYWKDLLATFSLGTKATADNNNLNQSMDIGDPTQVVARSARFDAITILRRLQQHMPDKQDVVQELLKQELFFVQRIADKIDVQQKASMMAFYAYLKARGFGAKDLKDDPNVTIDSLFLEQLWAGFGMGPITAVSAIAADDTFAGMPIPGWLFPDDWLVNSADAFSEIVGDAQMQSAQNRVAINILMRMMKNGLMLSDFPKLTPTTMSQFLVDKQKDGRTLSIDRRHALLRDIKEMVAQLPELRALISGDLIGFSRAFGRGHYPNIYPELAWYEWFGDLFNAKNIIFFWGPNAIYSTNSAALTGGKVAVGGSSSVTTATTISVREKFIQTMRLDKLSQWIANGRVGKELLAQRGPASLLKFDKTLKASRIGAAYSLTSNVAGGSANIASSLLLYGGTSVLAQQQGYGPGAQLLIEAVAEIGFAGMLADAARAGGIKPARIIDAADEIIDRATKQVKAVEARNGIVTNVQEAATNPANTKAAAKKIKAAKKEAEASFPPTQGESFPQDLVEASNYSSSHAAKALKKGDVDEVTRATKTTKKVNKQLQEQAEGLQKKASKAKSLAKQAETGKPPKSTLSRADLHNQFVPTVNKRITTDRPYERFWAPKLHKEKIAGANLEAGDRALRNGSLDTALDHYSEARRKLIEAVEKKAANSDQKELLDLLEKRIAMIFEHNETSWARKAAKKFAGELNHAKPISQNRANTIAAQIDAKLADDIAPKLKRLNEDLEAAEIAANKRLQGVTDPVEQNKIIAAYHKRLAELEAEKSGLLEIEGVEFFREGPGSLMWKVEHEGETFFVKYSLQSADKNALQLDSTASALADNLGINTFSNKLTRGQKNPLLVSRGVDVGANFGDLNDGEMLSFIDEYAEQTVFRAWLGDPDGHANNLMLSKDGDLLPFDFDRAHIGDEQAHTLYVGHFYKGDEQALMRGSVLWSHGSIGDEATDSILDQINKSRSGKSFRMVADTDRKIYSAMARIQQMMSYKRLQKTVDKIKALAADETKLKQLLEQGGWPDVDTATKVLKERASLLEETLKPLFDNELIDNVPRIVLSQLILYKKPVSRTVSEATSCIAA